VYGFDDLARLTEHERAAIMRHLVALRLRDPLADRRQRNRRRMGMTILLCACLFLAPWIVYLALSLPQHYEAGAWQVAWVGLDIMELAALGTTVYLIWRRRQLAIVAAVITGTLLVCDAWFDVTLSAGRDDFWITILTAVFGELPLAALLFLFVARVLSLTVRMAWTNLGREERMPPIWKLRMFSLADPEEWAMELTISEQERDSA
jgi:hypothetical protein